MQAVAHIYIEKSQGPAQFIALGNLAVHRAISEDEIFTVTNWHH